MICAAAGAYGNQFEQSDCFVSYRFDVRCAVSKFPCVGTHQVDSQKSVDGVAMISSAQTRSL